MSMKIWKMAIFSDNFKKKRDFFWPTVSGQILKNNNAHSFFGVDGDMGTVTHLAGV